MSGFNRKSAVGRYEASRVIDEGCGRAMAARLDIVEAAGTIGAKVELHAGRDAPQRLHTAAFEEASPQAQSGLARWLSSISTDAPETLGPRAAWVGR